MIDARQTSPAILALFLAPAILVFAGFTAYPVVRTFYDSLHLIGPNGRVGVRRPPEFFQCAVHRSDVLDFGAQHCNFLTVAGTLLDVFGGLLLALFLFAKVPFVRLLRVIWFLPVLMSYVVVGVIWVWIYDYDWGLLNLLLRVIGLGAFEHSWLGDPATALWAVMGAHLWKWLGFNMIIFLAALHALPEEVLGAAELDNCGWFAKVVYIIIPMLRPTLVNLTVLSFIGKMMISLTWSGS